MTKIQSEPEEANYPLHMLKVKELLILKNKELNEENIHFKAIKNSMILIKNIKSSEKLVAKNYSVKKLKKSF